jgi:hypothetical protein
MPSSSARAASNTNEAVLVPGVNTLLGGTLTSNGIDGLLGNL